MNIFLICVVALHCLLNENNENDDEAEGGQVFCCCNIPTWKDPPAAFLVKFPVFDNDAPCIYKIIGYMITLPIL